LGKEKHTLRSETITNLGQTVEKARMTIVMGRMEYISTHSVSNQEPFYL